jgi:hypothetical protein
MKDLINYDMALAALHKAVKDRGVNFKYPDDWRAPDVGMGYGGCMYSNEAGEPLCIVGYALHSIDPDLMPDEYDTSSASAVLDMLADKIKPDEHRAIEALYRAAQMEQDCGATWGDAVRIATDRVKSLGLR